ncbi:uncharacterized protein LOC114742281 [Neltuma alba]|uniref:uncharacterized protein LOC114742281 n=1 Tax=Neltuma alba TaxID=207710 RepID=UPI0010A4CEDC|nr:uncharacterized protein LOC114742281 [Prosopis alba]
MTIDEDDPMFETLGSEDFDVDEEEDESEPLYIRYDHKEGNWGNSNSKLYLDQSFKNAVAMGVVYSNGDEFLHNSQLPENILCVRIDVCTNGDAQLPFPTLDRQTMVRDVIGAYVAWPMGLIEPFQKEGNGIQVEFDRHIYSANDIFGNIDWHVLDDILHFRWHLYHDLLMDNERVKFSFINPYMIGQHTGKKDIDFQSNKIRVLFNKRNSQYWILIVINPATPLGPLIYYLDPLEHGEPRDRPDIIRLLNSALIGYRDFASLSYSKAPDTTKSYVWKKIKCPFKPNINDYDYYIMRFMKDIITHDQTFIPDSYYEDAHCAKYTDN